MDPVRWQSIRHIFHQAVELPTGEREEFIAVAADGDQALRDEVESLLASLERDPSFIEPAGDRVIPNVLDELASDQMIGRRFGAYKIVREIGRGGMGSVYLGARADDQFRKRAAIKLIRTGMNTGVVTRRFLSERQILASLDHPNIARLLDGGTSDEGLPYLIMEFIEGLPVTEYCDSRRLGTTERLGLFRQVCSAVHYAHQNLVIHRDIKPGNILVTPDGTVKLLDFGIAKLLAPGPALDATTQMGAAGVMTPDYASPEQVRGHPITTATDVYSLGVLLYELLSGHRPYRMTSSSPVEIIRAICEQEPDRPSTAVARVITLPDPDGDTARTLTPESVSRVRASQPDKLRRQLEGDLDNIVLKAMRKEPRRRYASAEQLSEDIRRYLAGLPVIARKDTLAYRAAKFVRRHKAAVSLTVLAALALISATVATSWEARRARQATIKAEQRFAEDRRLASSLIAEVQKSMSIDPYGTPTQRLLAQKTLDYLNSLARDAGDDPAFLGELAEAYHIHGYFQSWSLQDNPDALVCYDKAIKFGKRRAAIEPNSIDAKKKLSELLGARIECLNLMGRVEEALQTYEERLPVEESILAAQPNDPARRMTLAEIDEGYGETLRSLIRLEEANNRFRTAVSLATEAIDLFRGRAREPQERVDLSLWYLKQGDMYEKLNELQNAAESYRTAGEIAQAVHAENPEILQAMRNISSSHWYLGQILDRSGDHQGALESFQVSLKTVVEADGFQKDPSHYGEAKYSIIVGKALCKVGRKQQGVSLIRRGIELTEDGIQVRKEISASRYYGPELLSWAADALNIVGRKEEAIAVDLRAIEIVEQAAQNSPRDPNPLLRVTYLYESVGDFYAGFDAETKTMKIADRVQLAEARRWYQKALDVLRDTGEKFKLTLTGCAEQVDGLRQKLAECDSHSR